MIKFLSACAALFVTAGLALASNVTVPPLGNTHLHLGGGTKSLQYDTSALTVTVDGRDSSTFYIPLRTNSLSFSLTNFVDGQEATIQVSSTGTNAQAVITSATTSSTYALASNSPNVFLRAFYFEGTYHVREITGNKQSPPTLAFVPVGTNATTFLPTAPRFPGEAIIWCSNGYPYITVSTSGPALGTVSATWTGTNKLGW